MTSCSLSHLSDGTLLRDLAALVARDRTTTALLLAHLAEVDARRLYLPAAYPSLFAYCVGELRLSEEAAFKRIKAARAARRFPAIFEAVARGRLHLSAVVLLAPYLTEETADALLAAATHRSKAEIERLLAARYPRPDVLAWVAAIPASSATPSAGQQAPGPVEDHHAPGHGGGRSRVKPLAPQSFAVQFTMSRSTHEKVRYAQALLGHQLPSGDIAQVVDRALDALITRLERRKLAATGRPRPGRAGSGAGRGKAARGGAGLRENPRGRTLRRGGPGGLRRSRRDPVAPGAGIQRRRGTPGGANRGRNRPLRAR